MTHNRHNFSFLVTLHASTSLGTVTHDVTYACWYCTRANVYVCILVHVPTCTYVSVHMPTCVCVCVCTYKSHSNWYVYQCVCVCWYTCQSVHDYGCTCANVYVCMGTCAYVNMCMGTCAYVYMCMGTYLSLSSRMLSRSARFLFAVSTPSSSPS